MSHHAEKHLPSYRVRPRFEIETSHSIEYLEENIKNCLKLESATCKGRVRHGHATLIIPHEAQHYWSPQLSITLEETEAGTLIRGLYGPRPAVWTMFVFFYSTIAIAILFIIIFGMSRMSVNQSGAILWLIPILILIFVSLYLVAYFGQKMGQDQMVILHSFLEDSTGLSIDAHED